MLELLAAGAGGLALGFLLGLMFGRRRVRLSLDVGNGNGH